jgi:uncharacterized glyoxalase superfamily protein PhnB
MKAKKFRRVSPFIPVNHLRNTPDYYRDELGFYDEWLWGEIDGGIRRDDMQLIFTEEPEFTNTINNENTHFVLIWFVDNVDEVYLEFKQRNIKFEADIENKPWGIREFTIKDINGYIIRISESIDLVK